MLALNASEFEAYSALQLTWGSHFMLRSFGFHLCKMETRPFLFQMGGLNEMIK